MIDANTESIAKVFSANPKCFIAGTLVLTATGNKKIEVIKVGEILFNSKVNDFEKQIIRICCPLEKQEDYHTEKFHMLEVKY